MKIQLSFPLQVIHHSPLKIESCHLPVTQRLSRGKDYILSFAQKLAEDDFISDNLPPGLRMPPDLAPLR